MIVYLSYICQVVDRIAVMENANWLRELRSKRNLTQDDLVAQLQLAGFSYTRSSINNWENGYNPAPLKKKEFRVALAKILGVSVRTLLKKAGYEVEVDEHSEIAEQVAIIIDQLPEDKQQLVLRLVEQVAKG